MLPLILNLQSNPGNLGKFSRTTAETAAQKPQWQKGNCICWEYSVVTGTQPTHKPVETVNGSNENEIKLTIPIIVPISTLLNALISGNSVLSSLLYRNRQRSAVCLGNRGNLDK